MSGLNDRRGKMARAARKGDLLATWGPRHRGSSKAELRAQLAEAVINTPGARPLADGIEPAAANTVPACVGCNWSKDAFTLEEFRLYRGLNSANPTARFACEIGPSYPRDWLCVHSPEYERSLVLRQFPEALARYQKARGSWADR